jgi:hypothetical protein
VSAALYARLLAGTVALFLVGGCDSLYSLAEGVEQPGPSQQGANRPPSANLLVHAQGVMAPVQAQIALSCADPDGDDVTHLLSYSGTANYDVTSANAVSLFHTFTRSVEIRGLCRDSRNASSSIARHSLFVIDATAQRDSVLLLTNGARASAGAPSLGLTVN